VPISRYIPNVLRSVRDHRNFFLAVTVAALALRLFFFAYFPAITTDSRVYADLASNWLQHGVYGETQATQIVPTDARLPGYPGFLAVIFWLFGIGNFKAVMLIQILVDIVTCFVIADLTRRMISDRAARIAFVLAGLCPFLANYSAAALTETLEIFFTTLALDFAVIALDRTRESAVSMRVGNVWAATGAAIAACILLRPDGGILLAAVVLYIVAVSVKSRTETKFKLFRRAVVAGIIITLVALAPLVPWTIRNFHTIHHFQPLAPRYATEADELVLRGFNRWVKTWIIDYVSVQEIYWSVPGVNIDAGKLPSRAVENPFERDATLAVITDYNQEQDIDADLDARFTELAVERIRNHPVRYYVVLPTLRIADMWLRPRAELLPTDPRWWEFNDDTIQSVVAVGFGLLNLAYVAAALLGLITIGMGWGRRGPSEIRWAGLLIGFVVLRSAFLGTLENPEPRYVLECYPAVIVFAAAYLASLKKQSR
jgi:4-amino-4-deoxy-L-arabinose transferase-like glycosyltransferase